MSGRNVSKEPAGETSDESFYEQYMEGKDFGWGRQYVSIEGTTQYLCTAYSF